MKRAWRQRLRLLLLLPFVALFTTGTNFLDCDNSGSTSETPQDESSWFQPEYDFMFGYNVFPNFDVTCVADVFAACNTYFDIVSSDIIYPAESVAFDSLLNYAYHHSIKVNGELINGAYILALPDAPGKPNSNALGVTISPGDPGIAASFIFVQAVRDAYPGDASKIEYAVIHECGHLRANLSHLCSETSPGSGVWEVNPDHNDSRCVMSNWPYSSCTLYDVTVNPHFCPADRERIKKVTW